MNKCCIEGDSYSGPESEESTASSEDDELLEMVSMSCFAPGREGICFLAVAGRVVESV